MATTNTAIYIKGYENSDGLIDVMTGEHDFAQFIRAEAAFKNNVAPSEVTTKQVHEFVKSLPTSNSSYTQQHSWKRGLYNDEKNENRVPFWETDETVIEISDIQEYAEIQIEKINHTENLGLKVVKAPLKNAEYTVRRHEFLGMFENKVFVKMPIGGFTIDIPGRRSSLASENIDLETTKKKIAELSGKVENIKKDMADPNSPANTSKAFYEELIDTTISLPILDAPQYQCGCDAPDIIAARITSRSAE